MPIVKVDPDALIGPEALHEEVEIMTTPAHCPGFETFRHLSAFLCRCPECGKEKEIFSDEFNRQHTCAQCGQPIDFSRCGISAAAEPPATTR